jgi:hypothetical protein
MLKSFSKKSSANVEAEGRHAERGEQPDAAEQRYDVKRTSIGFRLFVLSPQDVCNNRIHGNLPIRFEHLV